MEFNKCYEGEYSPENLLKPDHYYIKHNWTPCNSIKYNKQSKKWVFVYDDGRKKKFFNMVYFHAMKLIKMLGLIPVKKRNIQGEYMEYRTKEEHKNELIRDLNKMQRK